MTTKIYIIILLSLALIFIYLKYYNNNIMEGLMSNEAVQNVASLYNTSLLTVSNLTIPSGGVITVASDSTNKTGIVNLGTVNSSRTDGSIDITGSGKLNMNTTGGMNVKSDVSIGKTLTVAGKTTLNGDAILNGTTTLKNIKLGGTFGPISVKSISLDTKSGDDQSVTLTCNDDNVLMSCACYNAYKNCDGVTYSKDGKSCTVHSGAGVSTGSALCMKIGYGTS